MTKTTEAIVHQHVLNNYLENSVSSSGLGWVASPSTQVSQDGLLHAPSFFQFLQHGNKQNVSSWANLMAKEGGQKKAEDKAFQAIKDKLEISDNIVQILRSSFIVSDQTFSLWNEPFGRGGMHASRFDFEKNERRTVSEISVHGLLGANTGFRKPDQSFYINGLLFSMMELKVHQTGQTAKLNGRKKLAGDFQEFAFGALLKTREEFHDMHGQDWPGIDADERRFPNGNDWRRRASHLMGAYTKTAWLGVLDMSDVWMIDDTFSWLSLCDKSLTKMLSGELGSNNKHSPNSHLDNSLMKEMIKCFAKLPDISGTSDKWQAVKQHLSGLLSDQGLAREIRFWHYPLTGKEKTSVGRKRPTLKPRAPQRVALQQAMLFVDEYYAHEQEALWMENDLKARLEQSLPVMSSSQVDEIIKDRLKYKNGQDAYSILIQGAAGLGKTNIAIWLALELYNKLEELPHNANPDTIRKQLFDRIVILTDRVELRSNIAKEAERSTGTKSQVLSIETKELLTKVLTGEPITDTRHKGTDIFVVNLQKFPSIYNDIQQGDIKLKHTVGRTAFIIDEVHRSQNGEYNEKTLNSFLEEISEAASSNAQKKNLIIGLTASPSKSILTRFGQWRPGIGPSDKAFWVPHFAYAMNQAVEDGYILNPLKGFVRLGVPLNIKTTETLDQAGSAERVVLNTDDLYENEERQKVVTRRFCEIFASTTMMAMPHGYRGIRVGKGKGMITVRSIRAAISMVRIVREQLSELAQNAKGKSWENYADVVKDIADNRVFVLYSNPGVGQGNTLEPCGKYNPQLGSSTSENSIIDGFKCIQAGSQNEKRNSIIIVVDKLLTGFDETTLHTLLIDRPMKDIALFQAMCRVNRTEKGKRNCLVIDSCHDEANAREAVRVFERYGNLSTSDLDGLDLLERIRKRRLKIIAWPGFKALRKKLDTALSNGERVEEIHSWTDKISLANIEQAKVLRETIGGYLFDQKIAKAIMNLKREDLDAQWLELLFEIHKLLRHSSHNKETAEVIFEIEKIDFDGIDLDELVNIKQVSRVEKDLVDTLYDDLQDNGGIPLIDQIEKLQDIEQEKALRTDAIRKFIDELFIRIDTLSQKRNNDEFKKMLHDPLSQTPYGELLVVFTNFFDGATSDRSWIGKQDQEKRRFREVARNRLDLLLGDYRMR